MVPTIRQIILYPENRAFNYIFHLCTLTACIGVASQYYVDGRVTVEPGDHVVAESAKFPRQVRIPISGAVHAAIYQRDVGSIEIGIDSAAAPQTPYTITTSGYQDLLRHVISPLFIGFYEDHRKWMCDNLGSSDGATWPPVLDFARVIRNACSHGGKLYFRSPTSRNVTWRGVTYGPSNQNAPVICGDLSIADMILLMLDASEALDACGCPVDPSQL